jgi:hypothetical protein
MFKRRPTYLMEIDAQIHFRTDEIARQDPGFAAAAEDDQMALMTESVTRQAHEAAGEELSSHGLRIKRSVKHKGHRWETGSEVLVNQLGEHHVTLTVVCEGDRDDAIAVFDGWLSRVSAFGGISEIGRMSVRGTDGTNLVRFSEEVEQAAQGLDDETAAMIDRLMDPDR